MNIDHESLSDKIKKEEEDEELDMLVRFFVSNLLESRTVKNKTRVNK